MNRYAYDLSINGDRSRGEINSRSEKSAMAAVVYMAVRRIRAFPTPLGRINISVELEERPS